MTLVIQQETDFVLHKEIPGFTTDPSMMFTYPSRIADLYQPSIEQIYVPPEQVPTKTIDIRVRMGQVGVRKAESLRRGIYTHLKSIGKKPDILDCTDQFLFDARFDADSNISHIIHNIAAPVRFARQVLSQHFDRDITIHVVLREKATALARQAYKMLDIPVICTDRDVYGNLIETSFLGDGFWGAIPQLFDLEFDGYSTDTPERVFIPRRANRKLINTEEIANFLEARGFKTLYFEDLTLSEEWSIARNAKVAVVVHGAAWAHFVFNRQGLRSSHQTGSGLKMIDVVSPAFTLRLTQYLAKMINGKRSAVRGQITPLTVRELDFKTRDYSPLLSPVKDPFKVDPGSLQMALDYLDVDT